MHNSSMVSKSYIQITFYKYFEKSFSWIQFKLPLNPPRQKDSFKNENHTENSLYIVMF